MDAPQIPADTWRRVRAARAYGQLTRTQAAEAMGVDEGQFDRFQGTKPNELRIPRLEQLWQLADACGLPRDFFLSDLDRLGETVPNGLPRFGPATPQRASDAPAPAPPGELGRRAQAPQTTEENREPLQRRTGPDSARGSA